MARRWTLPLGCGLALLGATGGFALYRVARRGEVRDVLPEFVEPSDGPHAPASSAFGSDVGSSSLASVRGKLAAAGLDCPDTSIRALLRQARADKRREVAARKARGEAVDAVSGASALGKPSPKESNPQVRLACDGVSSEALGDRTRIPARGRLLFVFDSPALPLRHVSFERTFAPDAIGRALEDVIATERSLRARFGPPTAAPAGPLRELPWLSPVTYEWRFADLAVRVSALSYGGKGVVVSEVVEVPWPVRADAPARKLASRP